MILVNHITLLLRVQQYILAAALNKTDFINAIRTNSRDGYEKIYRAYGGTLYGIILKHVAAENIAAELFTEIMVDIWNRIDECESAKIDLLQWMILRVVRPKLACHGRAKHMNNGTGIENRSV